MERRRIGQAFDGWHLAAGQGLDQVEKYRIFLAQLAQQGHTERRLVVLARQRLAKDERLLPVWVVLFADFAGGQGTGPGIVVGQEAGIGLDAHQPLVFVAPRCRLEQRVHAAGVAHGGKQPQPQGDQAAAFRFALRHLGGGEQQAAHEVAHGRRGGVHRQARQQGVDQRPSGARPHRDPESPFVFGQHAGRIRVDRAQGVHLDGARRHRGGRRAGPTRRLRYGRQRHRRRRQRVGGLTSRCQPLRRPQAQGLARRRPLLLRPNRARRGQHHGGKDNRAQGFTEWANAGSAHPE